MIAGVLLAAGGALLTYFDLWSAVRQGGANVLGFLADRSALPNWLIGIGVVAVALLGVFLIAIAWEAIRPGNNPLEHFRYTQDEFFGLRWRWKYAASGYMHEIAPFCEKCDLQVLPHSTAAFRAAPEFAFNCENCGHRAGPFDGDPDDLEEKVRRFAQQKLRSGAWKTRVAA